MSEETAGLPSAADLDAQISDLETGKVGPGIEVRMEPGAKAAHDAVLKDLTKPAPSPEKPKEPDAELPEVAPQERQPQAGPAAAEPVFSRHGEPFNPEIHAQLPTGDPKVDSTGKFILKEHDYQPKTPTPQIAGGK